MVAKTDSNNFYIDIQAKRLQIRLRREKEWAFVKYKRELNQRSKRRRVITKKPEANVFNIIGKSLGLSNKKIPKKNKSLPVFKTPMGRTFKGEDGATVSQFDWRQLINS